jgi:hypothetical protein
MKNKRICSALLASLLFASLLTFPANTHAQQTHDRFRGDTGVITVGMGQKVIVWIHGGALKSPAAVRFAWQRFMPAACNPDNVCHQVIQSQGNTTPVSVGPNEAVSFEIQGNGNSLRVQVIVTSGDVSGDAELIDVTGQVISHVIMANTEGDFH